MSLIRALLSLLISTMVFTFGQDSSKASFQFSKLLPIPDLSFFNQVYTGLDILEQMDFKPLEGKSIALYTNQTAVNRNGNHILDLLKNVQNVNVSVLLAPNMESGGLMTAVQNW